MYVSEFHQVNHIFIIVKLKEYTENIMWYMMVLLHAWNYTKVRKIPLHYLKAYLFITALKMNVTYNPPSCVVTSWYIASSRSFLFLLSSSIFESKLDWRFLGRLPYGTEYIFGHGLLKSNELFLLLFKYYGLWGTNFRVFFSGQGDVIMTMT